MQELKLNVKIGWAASGAWPSMVPVCGSVMARRGIISLCSMKIDDDSNQIEPGSQQVPIWPHPAEQYLAAMNGL